MTGQGNSSDQKQQKTGLRRTYAERRTVLAAERTFAAWVRTGLSSIAVGLAAAKLLENELMKSQLRLLAVGFGVAGVIALLLGLRSYHNAVSDLNGQKQHALSHRWLVGLTLLLIALGGLGLWVVW